MMDDTDEDSSDESSQDLRDLSFEQPLDGYDDDVPMGSITNDQDVGDPSAFEVDNDYATERDSDSTDDELSSDEDLEAAGPSGNEHYPWPNKEFFCSGVSSKVER